MDYNTRNFEKIINNYKRSFGLTINNKISIKRNFENRKNTERIDKNKSDKVEKVKNHVNKFNIIKGTNKNAYKPSSKETLLNKSTIPSIKNSRQWDNSFSNLKNKTLLNITSIDQIKEKLLDESLFNKE